ncbi:MAG TPA: molybdopterin-dependent oxidoreductase, partial [Microthrixaceae bacterium]|nr:molybdopterin-dependent oxidoreductase [Microthrixaceae bacterium]
MWPAVPEQAGGDADAILAAAADGKIDVLILLGADPLVDARDRSLARRALAATRTVIALDRFATESTAQAAIVLPVAGIAECDGTTTNLEGRVSTLNARVTAPGTARADWMVAADLAEL